MPELPEVETIRRDLQHALAGRTIIAVKILKSKDTRASRQKFIDALRGNAIKAIDRRGKLLILRLKNRNENILTHLKMTGQLIYIDRGRVTAGGHGFPPINRHLPNKHTQVVFTFKGGAKLYFNDLRRFGYMKLATDQEVNAALKKFGIEPLGEDFSQAAFLKLFNNRKTKLKSFLLNQQLIAGIGNIYADEICFFAGLMPSRALLSLTKKDKERLHGCIKTVLKKAVKYRGTTFSDYLDLGGNKGNYTKFLKVYGRDGLLCQVCKIAAIKKVKLIGRGTHYCPRCQR